MDGASGRVLLENELAHCIADAEETAQAQIGVGTDRLPPLHDCVDAALRNWSLMHCFPRQALCWPWRFPYGVVYLPIPEQDTIVVLVAKAGSHNGVMTT